jgi:predicted amidohydrolase YtcJ
MGDKHDLSRRGFLGAAAGAAAAATVGLGAGSAHAQPGSPGPGGPGGGDLALVNGKIHTFDENNSVVSQVLIRDGRFVNVGSVGGGGGPRTTIDLKGHTVIPGLIDNHCHFIRIGQAAGYDMRRLETAFSIEALQQIVADYAAEVPEGEFMTALRGLALRQWASPARHATIAELDEAAPHHPVVISQGTNGQTNTLGRDRLRDLGVNVSDTGSVNDDQAYIALSQFFTIETKKREMLRAADYALSIGMTGFIDEHGNVGSPGTAGFLNRVTGHDHILELYREGRLPVRVRARFGVNPPNDAVELLQTYVDHRWENFGDDMFKTAGIGEWAPRGADYQNSLLIMARRPIQYQQHLISTGEIQNHLNALEQFEMANPQFSVADLYWSGGHMDGMTEAQVAQSNNLGMGIIPQGWQYLTGNGTGPNFRAIVDLAEVPVGTGSDGARVAPLNAWSMIYFMTTGRNSGGALVGEGRSVTREEAIRLYSGPDQGWFSKEEDTFGGVGVGRYADLAVLAANVFDHNAVPDDALRKMTSVLTIVGGQVRYEAGVL